MGGGGAVREAPLWSQRRLGKLVYMIESCRAGVEPRWRQPAQHKAQIVPCVSLVNSPWGHNAAFPMLAEAPPFV